MAWKSSRSRLNVSVPAAMLSCPGPGLAGRLNLSFLNHKVYILHIYNIYIRGEVKTTPPHLLRKTGGHRRKKKMKTKNETKPVRTIWTTWQHTGEAINEAWERFKPEGRTCQIKEAV